MQLPTQLPKFPPAFLSGVIGRLPKLPFTNPPKLTFQDIVMGDPASKTYSLEANALLQPGQFTPGRGVVEASFTLGNGSKAPVQPYAYVQLAVLRNGSTLSGSTVQGTPSQVGTIPASSVSSRVSAQAALPASIVSTLQNGDVIQATLVAAMEVTDGNPDSGFTTNQVILGKSDTYQWTVGGVVAPPVVPPPAVASGVGNVNLTISSVGEGPMSAVRDVNFLVTRER